MSDGLAVFKNDFLSYVISKKTFSKISFGNMSYDYDLYYSDGEYFLEIYNVVLDHYGMPMRNILNYERHNISGMM